MSFTFFLNIYAHLPPSQFLRGGAIFLTLLCQSHILSVLSSYSAKYALVPSLISLSETTAAFSGRAVLAKHKGFSMYRPSAVVVARTIGDLPIFFVQLIIFTLIIYFMTGLKVNPGHYFTFFLFAFVLTNTTTAFFRFIGYSFGTFNNASKVSGTMFSVIVTVGLFVYRYDPVMMKIISMRDTSFTLRRCTPGSRGFDGSIRSITASKL